MNTPVSTDVLHFSSEALPKRDRMAIWSDLFVRYIAKVQHEELPSTLFYQKGILRKLPGVGLASMTSSGYRVIRKGQMLDDGTDDVGLTISTEGTGYMSQLGRETPLAPLNGVLLTSADPFSIHFPELTKFVVVRIPRAALAPAVSDLESLLARPLPQTEALQLLLAYVTKLNDQPLQSLELRQTVGTHLIDLMTLAVGANRDATEIAQNRGLRAARLNTIKADIRAQFANERLSVTDMAQRHQVTPRYIQMMFEAEGTTFTEFMMEERLLRARSLLTDARFVFSTISTIAYEVGFANLSYFNRSFRRRFGMTPSEVRAEFRVQH